MSNVTEVSKLIALDLSGVPDNKIAEVKKEVGDFLIESILRDVGDGKSPVQGERFKRLSKDYADEFKGGNTTPTMQLFGDLLDSLRAEDAGGSFIKIGHFGEQAPKADGHNQLSLEAKIWAAGRDFPKRRYIPAEGQSFKRSIERGIEEIIEGYRLQERIARGEEPAEDFLEIRIIDNVQEGIDDITGDRISADVVGLFSDDAISALIAEALRRRR